MSQRAELSKRHVETQLKAGRSPEQVVSDLVAMRWHPQSALELVSRTRGELKSVEGIVAPGPDLRGLPSALRVGDTCLPILMKSTKPNVVLLGGAASSEECAAIIDFARPLLLRSQVIVGDGELAGKNAETYARTSDQASFRPGACAEMDQVMERIAALTSWPATHFENPQVIRYRPGEDFAPHYDYFSIDIEGNEVAIEGQRLATAILYLNTPANGGMTAFVDSEMEIYPQRGNLLLFSYPSTDESSKSRHAGVPIASGEKWILTTFLRDSARPQAGIRGASDEH